MDNSQVKGGELVSKEKTFFKIYTEVYFDENLTGNEKLLYTHLQSISNGGRNEVKPSNDYLVKGLNITNRTLNKLLQSLEDKNLIKRHYKNGDLKQRYFEVLPYQPQEQPKEKEAVKIDAIIEKNDQQEQGTDSLTFLTPKKEREEITAVMLQMAEEKATVSETVPIRKRPPQARTLAEVMNEQVAEIEQRAERKRAVEQRENNEQKQNEPKKKKYSLTYNGLRSTRFVSLASFDKEFEEMNYTGEDRELAKELYAIVRTYHNSDSDHAGFKEYAQNCNRNNFNFANGLLNGRIQRFRRIGYYNPEYFNGRERAETAVIQKLIEQRDIDVERWKEAHGKYPTRFI